MGRLRADIASERTALSMGSEHGSRDRMKLQHMERCAVVCQIRTKPNSHPDIPADDSLSSSLHLVRLQLS